MVSGNAKWLTFGLVLALSGMRAHAGFFEPVFVDVAQDAGVLYVQQEPLESFCTVETFGEDMFNCMYRVMTGGIAIGDYDNDGLDDIFVTRMTNTDILYRNNGDGTFTDVTASAGLTLSANTNGALWVDIDNDGDLDLIVTTMFEVRFLLYVNNGDGTFTEDAVARGVGVIDGAPRSGWSVAAGDYNRDGYLDIFTGEWFSPSPSTNMSKLMINRGAEAPGYFEDVTADAGIVLSTVLPWGDPGTQPFVFAPAFVDLNQDGWLDLALASDFGNSQLFWNVGDGTFEDGTAPAEVGTDENGMGSTFGDMTGNGYLDWFVTSVYDDECEGECSGWGTTGNRLYLNNGDHTFTDGTDAFGVRDGSWGWGTAMFDHNNNGLLDIVMTNGFITTIDNEPEKFHTDTMRFWLNNGNGTMTEVGDINGVNSPLDGKGLVVFDFDGDGDLDIMVANTAQSSILYENQGGNTNDWLRIKFAAEHRPFEGLNAKIRLQLEQDGPIQYREMGVSTHFLGQSERVAHFGLGTPSAAPIHQITVEWLVSGEIQTFNNVARNQVLTIIAPAAEVVDPPHSADINGNFSFSLSELLRVVQLYNCGEYHINPNGEDGFACGNGDQNGPRHSSDYSEPHWNVDLSELLRTIQLYRGYSFIRHYSGEDGYMMAPVL